MGQLVCMGGMMKCSFGNTSSSLMVLPKNRVMCCSLPAATILDNIPMVNILPFGMCMSPSNPMVAAAFGSPMPCIPVTAAPWLPGCPTVLIANIPALNNSSKLICSYGGIIEFVNPGQMTVSIP